MNEKTMSLTKASSAQGPDKASLRSIPAAMDQLFDSISKQDVIMDQLYHRLVSILGESSGDVDDIIAEEDPTPLADQIKRANRSLIRHNTCLENMLNSIEL